MITKVTDKIRYIGCDDAAMELFESQYDCPEGMCYNSYLILDRKIAVIDSVDPRCGEEWLAKIENELQGRTPDYLVQHHMEPDHSGCVKMLLDKYPQSTLVCSAIAAKYLPQFFEDFDMSRVQIVKEGDSLDLGEHSLSFIAANFVHWPEVLMSYCPQAKLLFSADGFGKFGVYDADEDDWACEARRYYFNICGKYGPQVAKVLEKAAALGEGAIETICPLHGPVLSGEKLAEALRLYTIWSHYDVETQGIFIAHASIHGGTAAAAEKMRSLLLEAGCPKVAVSDLCREDMAEAIEDAFRYGTILCCASSYDGDVFPPMHYFLHKLSIKGYQKRRIGLLENGTWAPSAARAMKTIIEKMKDVEVVEPVVTIKSRMHEDDLPKMQELAAALLK
ncbi:MAG: MBL fold metallo-hydrolase [Bacteroidales bacterium]|nr:MBL fold metallo-hydrolase [Bacteroidales bacterium]